ncbi:3161_t:CDS:2 [Funneliformis mosseae]|uniref:3161_t:CDS:1 n=1 Tax=Funneliformis mosseae TaxID=27381 RepID=A0A9N8V559_FUNMO|nr:3161_t:CDS:2 [Funneliformis mosseae]
MPHIAHNFTQFRTVTHSYTKLYKSSSKRQAKQSESHGEASSSERPDLTKPSEVKRRKTRNSPDLKWIDNGNSA